MRKLNLSNEVFIEKFQSEPYQLGVLDGLTFAVKDNIDIKNYKTSCGNPTYRDVNPLAKENAASVHLKICLFGLVLKKLHLK